METRETIEQSGGSSLPPSYPVDARIAALPAESSAAPVILPQAGAGARTHCGHPDGLEITGTHAVSYAYAIGNIEPRFPSLSVEKEFAQATGRADTGGLTDRKALKKVLSDGGNRYLVRQLCWFFTVEGLETYLLLPRDPRDFDLLVEVVRDKPDPGDLDVVIGMRGPIAPPEM
jgi:hypothetical protein